MLVRSIGPSIPWWDRPSGWVSPFDDVLENWFRDPTRSSSGAPRFVSRDDGQALALEAELPGLSDEDFDIHVEDQTLTVNGRRHEEAPEGYRYLRRERSPYQFVRAFSLPDHFDPSQAEARLENGFLRIRVPRRPEAQPRQIPVSVS
jgi:HSP20 family protein